MARPESGRACPERTGQQRAVNHHPGGQPARMRPRWRAARPCPACAPGASRRPAAAAATPQHARSPARARTRPATAITRDAARGAAPCWPVPHAWRSAARQLAPVRPQGLRAGRDASGGGTETLRECSTLAARRDPRLSPTAGAHLTAGPARPAGPLPSRWVHAPRDRDGTFVPEAAAKDSTPPARSADARDAGPS